MVQASIGGTENGATAGAALPRVLRSPSDVCQCNWPVSSRIQIAITVRRAVLRCAVGALNKQEVSLGEFAATLALDRSAASRRLRDATDRGYLANLETR